jgi:hypothetical protein
MGPNSQRSIVGALNGLTDAIGALVTELRMQRVSIAKLSAQRILDKEDHAADLNSLGALVLEQEQKVNRLHLVQPGGRPNFGPPPLPRRPAR